MLNTQIKNQKQNEKKETDTIIHIHQKNVSKKQKSKTVEICGNFQRIKKKDIFFFGSI